MSSPVWHPFTQHGLEPQMLPISRAEGAWLEASDGQRIFDGISSWWVITHGHRHPKIVRAIQEQADKLDQVVFAGFTHEPAETVARELIKIAPSGLAHVFFSDSGSTAVEVALKMALGYWRNTGQKRTRILALEHAYHGDTVGTMSAGARGVFNAAYAPLLFDVERIPYPAAGREQLTFDALDKACRSGDTAAFILEPLILGAGGMLIYDAATLAEMRRICSAYGVLFIADEVMTGFGRTGTLFASEQAHISPDILCVAKGITGGSIPLAATLCSEAIYAAHLSEDRARTFFHSSSYTGNAIACAAAVANLEIWRTEPVRERIAALAAAQEQCLEGLEGDPHFANGRQIGTITAVELTGRAGGYLDNVALSLRSKLLARGVLLRPLGNTVYVMPPYCATADELKSVYEKLAEAVDEVSA
ncbi:MAG TPA: adenosylmethionine--8-amino-7-oxononanoate transaminase [Hyphomicrobium sp.]|jgi:adenosylmethionine-8-amino-7-oxononanoate aminotransferase|uniref:adenosylmethionine--8-amino-7-oxononanoate transaminase n=1 Tax=Hyphomicrobium sp. TaxID=82 RepID=UPI002BC327A4|nr:adenosylmethionine--8-amino-7-oxononanoate transaminase [Hyphomicrobium sp.]HXE01726.1 adenosylmethionine--8-amino-7-oxononanoate transaminase [Hyphomicrobium sp.]